MSKYAAAMQRVLRGVQQLPGPARFPDYSLIEHVWGMMNWELTLSPESATTIAELRRLVQDAWDNLSQDDIGTFMNVCMREYTPALPPQGGTLCINAVVANPRHACHWAPLILQAFHHFVYVTAHSPTLPSLYLRHSSFSNNFFASPTSQLILQPFFRFSYVRGFSLASPGEPPMVCPLSGTHKVTIYKCR